MIVQRLKQIVENICNAEDDALKCESGNAAAGRRLRKACLEASKELKLLRVEILELIKK